MQGIPKLLKAWLITKVLSWQCKGWHSNIFCTPIFVLGQDESQGSTTKITDGKK